MNAEIGELVRKYTEAKSKKTKEKILATLESIKPEWDELRTIEADLTSNTADEVADIQYKLALFVLTAVDENNKPIFEEVDKDTATTSDVIKAIEKIGEMPADTLMSILMNIGAPQDIFETIPEELRDFFF